MLIRDALRKGETKAGSLLLPFADKRLEQGAADAFRHSVPVIGDAYDKFGRAYIQTYFDARRLAVAMYSLTCIED